MEWFPEYWKIAEPYGNDPATARQFLASQVIDETGKVPVYRPITFEEFKRTRFDVLIASYDRHIEPYRKLIQNYQPQAKLIQQVGNSWNIDWQIIHNALISTKPFDYPSSQNVLFYHQWFDTEVYSPTPPLTSGKILRSFVNTLQTASLFKKDWADFQQLEQSMSDYVFSSHGASCRDGIVKGDASIARLMKSSWFGIHFKEGGDGYGHVIHQWFAVGRPVLFKGSQYKDKLAGELLRDGITGFDIELHGIEGTASLLKSLTSVQYESLCQNVRQVFSQVVNFGKDTKRICEFLARLI